MGLRPSIVRRRVVAPAPNVERRVPATDAPARVVRPIPERTSPIRTADRLLKNEPVRGAPAPAPASPVGDAVSHAYQVFDEYLKEGRQYAEGQSAWHNRQAAATAAIPTDLPSALIWAFEQMGAVAKAVQPPISAVEPTPSTWPQPRWPTTSLTSPLPKVTARADSRSAQQAPEWVPWDFEANPASDSARPISSRPGGVTPAAAPSLPGGALFSVVGAVADSLINPR